jgi:glutaminase
VTGDRNRAIAWLLRNYSRLPDDVDFVLDVYFKQCSILVTSHDLAVMAATLANSGINPVTREQIISPYVVARTLSVMTSSGMYDYAGQWLYKVGMPAKSGVGGGIIASLPAALGMGTYSPNLDTYGNSVRGIKVCERISSYLNLHVLSRKDDVKTCILADYSIMGISSRRNRRQEEIKILQKYHSDVRIIELIGALTFATMDYISRTLVTSPPNLKYLILDLRRVPGVSAAAEELLVSLKDDFRKNNIKCIITGVKIDSEIYEKINSKNKIFNENFALLDDAIEWVEDEIIHHHGGKISVNEKISLNQQSLLADFSEREIQNLSKICNEINFKSGERIITAGEPSNSFYFLLIGKVSVKLRSGVRLSSLSAGMSFGEMALLENIRSADIWADTDVTCLELTLGAYNEFRKAYPECGEKLMRNGAYLLSQRLRMANTKVDILSSSG